MQLTLTLNETRVLGSMIEKEITTPDQYPLSLNALTNACNQKSNREPVMALAETEVQETLDNLAKRRLIMEKSGFGSRVPKYQHRFAGTEFSEFRFDERELAVVCVLFLRGPQTPGELRSRTQRLCKFNDVGEVEAVLNELTHREDGPFVTMLAREPGRRRMPRRPVPGRCLPTRRFPLPPSAGSSRWLHLTRRLPCGRWHSRSRRGP